MRCPVCLNTELKLQDIDRGLSAGVCLSCNGRWISLQSYQAWLEFEDHEQVKAEENNKAGSVPNNDRARICPKCKRILTKYKIAVESALNIDRCTICSGVWLDEADWATLKNKKLHLALDKIFTDHWQNEIRLDDTKVALAGINREKFGRENFELVRSFKKWVFEQKNPEEILSYLSDSSPLQM